MQVENKLGRLYSMIDTHITNADELLAFEKSDSLVFLIPETTEDLDSLILTLRKIFLDVTSLLDVSIGVSDPALLNEVRQSLVQAHQAAHYQFGINSDKFYLLYSDLGLVRFFMDNTGDINTKALHKLYGNLIGTLEDYDEGHHTELLTTLEEYLKNNCSKTKTAKSLYIHNNTLLARLHTINKLLDCNVDHVEDRFDLQLALKLRFLFENDA